MNTEHTPGPWRVGNGSFVIADHPAPGIMGADDVHHYGGHLICESVNAANAHLIAAAPDLLEALKDMIGLLKDAGREYEDQWQPGQSWIFTEDKIAAKNRIKAARAVIAKAEGKA